MTETSETTVITCNCTVCKGLSARIGGNGVEYLKATKKAATMRHNMVRIAHSPLSRSASAQQFGPWAV